MIIIVSDRWDVSTTYIVEWLTYYQINFVRINQGDLDNENYNKYWKIPKSLIETCKNCEFRNVCTDCRAFLEEPNNVYSKPLKCGYNIETGEWEDWAQIPKHFNSIQYYDIKCSRPS